MTKMKYGQVLKRLRESAGLSQRALAEAASVAQPVVSNIENGHQEEVGATAHYRICAALGVTCEQFKAELDQAEQEEPNDEHTNKPKGKRK
jgi:transcriptional regulator with XRE-family HTH domain